MTTGDGDAADAGESEGAIEAAEGGESDDEGADRRCDFCRLPIPTAQVTAEFGDETYTFCSESCRDAVSEMDQVFTQYHGFRRVATGVAPLDESLPQGIPRNSFVLFTDLAGTRTEAIRAELVWRALRRGEPAVIVTFLEPPISVVQEFVTLDWNVLPYIERGQLRFVDAFTYRMEDRERLYDRLDDWNTYLASVFADVTTRVRDPSDVGELQNRIDDTLETLGMQDEGIVVIDSLTEFGSLVQPVQAYRFVKDVRAEVCKSRFVPIYASATVAGDEEGFPHDLDYMVDGIVELGLNDELVEGSLMKQIRVRKMSGVLNLPKWVLYEYTAGEGIVTIEPHEGPPGSGDGDDADEGSQDDTADEGGEAAEEDAADGGGTDAGADADADEEGVGADGEADGSDGAAAASDDTSDA